ncbi:endonuclease/exonuclease/phosphatase family protein [Luteococcus sp. OSA5]|uniref:endonuclease/exonuclease/phosphatase family protein n=1 Tax=Luteococcus sp. OSA5 TaxID=3401630 RepID=UPI003B4317DF
MRSLIATSVLGLALAASCLGPAVATPNKDNGAQRTLVAASYNIHHAEGADGVLDLERIATVLEGTDAQVIGLQEVDRHWGDRSENVDQAKWLADRLGMHHCYTANLDNPPAEGSTQNRQYGTAILSDFPLENCTSTALTNHPKGEQRSLAQADLTVRGVPVRFYNTHLTHNSDEGREVQADEVNEIVSSDDRPAILVGDLNARPDKPVYQSFTKHLTDVWPVVGEGDGFTYDSDDPKGRIDYILVSGQITPTSMSVIPTIASDHMPIVASLELPHPSEVHKG